MSWSALDWASKQKTGNGTNKLVLLCLANYTDDKNTCFPSYKTLISITEMSRSTIIRALKSLEQILKTIEKIEQYSTLLKFVKQHIEKFWTIMEHGKILNFLEHLESY